MGWLMDIEQEVIEVFFEQMSSAAYIKDENLNFVYVNPDYADFCGFEPEYFIGKSSFELTESMATKLLEQDEAKVLATGVATQTSDRATSSGGATIWREIERKPIVTNSGVRYLAVTLRDISKYKELEFELQDKKEELARAQSPANKSDQRNSDFLGQIAHQINMPIDSILSAATSVCDADFDGDRKSFSDLIISSGNAVRSILDDISSCSEPDMMSIPIKSGSFDLFKLVCDLTCVVMVDARDQNLEVSTFIDPDIPMRLLGDEGKIRQILLNLINNTIKTTDIGKVDINIRLVSDDHNNLATIRFEIGDAGDIHDDDLSLAVSNALVGLMGGEIGIIREPDAGSSYWFELGLDIPKAIEQSTLKDPDLREKRFIVIDHDEFDRALLEHQLSEWGGDVAACSSSDEAVAVMCALFEKGMSVEGILIDDQTIHDSDSDFHSLMKDNDQLSHIPLFMMVDDDQRQLDVEQVPIDPNSQYTTKPLDILSLKSIISDTYFEEAVGELVDQNVNKLVDLSTKMAAEKEDHGKMKGLQVLTDNYSDVSDIDILIFESNTVSQIMLAQILETTGHTFKITSDLSEGEAIFKSSYPKMVIIDATSREFDNEDTRLRLEKLKRFNSVVPLLGLTAYQRAADDSENASLLMPILDDQITKPISPVQLFNKITEYMETTQVDELRSA